MTLNENEHVCCRLETWVLLYGIINTLVTALASIGNVGLIVYAGILLGDLDGISPVSMEPYQRYETSQLMWILFILILLLPLAFISLLISILLVVGVAKKKAGLLLTYFVFGVIVGALSLAGTVTFLAFDYDMTIAGLAFSVIAVYVLPLILVFMVYKKFSGGEVYQMNYKHLH